MLDVAMDSFATTQGCFQIMLRRWGCSKHALVAVARSHLSARDSPLDRLPNYVIFELMPWLWRRCQGRTYMRSEDGVASTRRAFGSNHL